MFGYKDAGLLDALLRFRVHDGTSATKKSLRKTDARIAETPADLLLRRETYFAVASTLRWNR